MESRSSITTFMADTLLRPPAALHELKAISATASSWIQRWALTLSAYHYNIRYKAATSLSNADALSRLPRPITTSSFQVTDLVHLVDHLSAMSVNASTKYPLLAQVRRYTQLGEEFKSRACELSVLDGCILWGCRIVVPLLEELHKTHPGCCGELHKTHPGSCGGGSVD